MNVEALRSKIEDLFDRDLTADEHECARDAVEQLMDGLETGTLRTAEPDETGGWKVNAWVKKGVLLAFRASEMRDYSINRHFQFRDKEWIGPRQWIGENESLRVVPGGTMIRRGSFIGQNVIVMPPAYINVGAWIGDGTMIDSHALVGSCAQIGSRVHLSAAAQIGGVLEPIGTTPVIVEDDAFIGGNTGIFEGARVSLGAVIAAGVILTGSTPIYDLANEKILRPKIGEPLIVPPYAVVIPGSRPASGDFAQKHGLQYQTPIIVKYRNPDESPILALESSLR